MALRPHLALLGLASAAGTVTALLYTLADVDVAYRSASAHAFMETAAALIALLVAYLALQRFRVRPGATSLMLFAAFLLSALSSLVFAALPAAFSSFSPDRFSTWTSLAASLGAAILLVAAAALATSRVVRRPERAVAVTGAACVLFLTIVAGAALALGTRLPEGIDPQLSPVDTARVVGNPVLLGTQLVTMVLLFAASIGFARRGGSGDALTRWIAAGLVLVAFSRLNYFLFPSRFSDWVYAGDFFRLGAYLVFLVGATREIQSYQRAVARDAIAEERRRIARDLHDGLKQELAFILLEGRRLAGRAPAPSLEAIVSAAERGLAESRRAIDTLSSLRDRPLAEALASEARAVTDRAGVRLELSVEPGIDLQPRTREAVVRVVREAVTNATRHGRAGVVAVELAGHPRLQLRVADDGVGFDPQQRNGSGFGLRSMRERIESLGGELHLDSEPGSGTRIEATLP